MPIPFDPEEIFGVAVVDAFRRGSFFVGCVVGASLMAAFALGVGGMVASLDVDELTEWLSYSWFLFLAPCLSGWGILYVPSLLAAGFFFTTSQGSLFKPFLGFTGLHAFLIVVTASEFDLALLIAFVMLLGCFGGFVWLVLLLEQRMMRKAEEHLVELAVINQQRREGLRDDFGIEAYDEVNDR